MPHIDFWFDVLSPYAYFASRRIGALAETHGATLRLRPVLLAALLDHHGHLGPAEIPSKREHTFKDILRYARLHDVPLAGPPKHPFNPLTALRCCLPEVAGDDQPGVVRALFDAGWGAGVDLGEPAAIAEALYAAGFDGPAMVKATRDPEVKAALRGECVAALERGVFGVPTCDVDGELFWGNDRLDYVALRLAGNDPLPHDAAGHMLSRPAGAARPGAAGRGAR